MNHTLPLHFFHLMLLHSIPAVSPVSDPRRDDTDTDTEEDAS